LLPVRLNGADTAVNVIGELIAVPAEFRLTSSRTADDWKPVGQPSIVVHVVVVALVPDVGLRITVPSVGSVPTTAPAGAARSSIPPTVAPATPTVSALINDIAGNATTRLPIRRVLRMRFTRTTAGVRVQRVLFLSSFAVALSCQLIRTGATGARRPCGPGSLRNPVFIRAFLACSPRRFVP